MINRQRAGVHTDMVTAGLWIFAGLGLLLQTVLLIVMARINSIDELNYMSDALGCRRRALP